MKKSSNIYIYEIYSDDLDVEALQAETPVLRTILSEVDVTCFNDIYKHLKETTADKELVPNVVILCNLLIVNPSTSCTPERLFSIARRLKIWLRSTRSGRCFNALGLLNVHKELTVKLDLLQVGNDLNDEQHQYFGLLHSLHSLLHSIVCRGNTCYQHSYKGGLLDMGRHVIY